MIERRLWPRVEAAFPARITVRDKTGNAVDNLQGMTFDLQEKGIGLMLDNPLPLSHPLDIQINASPRYGNFQAEAVPLWNTPSSDDGGFRAGLRLAKIRDEHLPALKNILADYASLDSGFSLLIRKVYKVFHDAKDRFDAFDKNNTDGQKQIDFIEANKKDIFERLELLFLKIWEIIKDFEKDKYRIHQDYCIHVLGPLVLEQVEINRHGTQKPLGYSGDFTMMNYIYDYHRGNYLGNSSYEKLVNHYTCNIPISCSNIKRKAYLKAKILEALDKNDLPRILSVAPGPARELIEALEEGKINKPLVFKCLDHEKTALRHIEDTLGKIDPAKKRNLSVEFILRNVTSLIRDKEFRQKLQNFDLIYAFGIYDYLSDKMASRLTREFFQLLAKGGQLIIFNAGYNNDGYRAYYELLGEWDLIHRTREEILSWTKEIDGSALIRFEELADNFDYQCLNIVKQ